MLNRYLLLISICMTTTAFSQNPFLEPYNTPYDTHPFDRILVEHYEPALVEGMKRHEAEVDAIVASEEAPTFANTILALERAGELLDRVETVFFNLLEANGTEEMQTLAEKFSPMLSEHSNKITLNEPLFARIKAVYDNEYEPLQGEEKMLLKKYYDSFVRSGANLTGDDKERYRQLTMQLSTLTVKFAQNHLKETHAFVKVVTDETELSGLPETVREAAAQTAKEKGLEGWAFTLQYPSYRPVAVYADNRELRREMYMAYQTICCHDNENNNEAIVRSLVNTRMELAQLLGYKSYADYVLCNRMAENSANVYRLLDTLIDSYSPTALREVAEVETLAKELEGADFQLMPWDWAYYSEKLKFKKFNLDEERVRPYLELTKVKEGVFGLASRLYGISFQQNTAIPVYHPDVEAWEVYDKDGSFLGVLYTDFYPRQTKQSGAWMTNLKGQWKEDGINSRPHIAIVMNFTKPTATKPALLNMDEVETLLHEFGHSLHGMFADCHYETLSGTHVYRDFVELPSQIMENFARDKEFLHTFARHYETDELMPDSYVQQIIDASNFNVAYACLRQVSFGLLDMSWYSRETPFEGDVRSYEKEAWKRTQVLPSIPETCMSVQFSHIMDGGYSAGYYSYKWSEVLDADAYAVFQEKGIFNTDVAQSFRDNILSKGGSVHPMELYKQFRGQEPTVEALLRRNGIIEEKPIERKIE